MENRMERGIDMETIRTFYKNYTSAIAVALGVLSWIMAIFNTGLPGVIILLVSAVAGIISGIRGLKTSSKILAAWGLILCISCLIMAVFLLCMAYWIIRCF